MDRAINWAYLHETRDSFAIEKEEPSEEKSRRFVQLLRQAHQGRALSEEYLVELQNSTVSNPFDKATLFRHEQNHLHNGLRGAAGVSYVPPVPDLCRELMEELMSFSNQSARHVDPLVAAAVVAFGFVFLHPFMDGNGRLSRFLIHQTLCHAEALQNGLLLPVSVAMKHEESNYLEALKGFSKPARDFWNVTWLDADQMAFEFVGHSSIYRFWDATQSAEFTLRMARRALEVELREETEFLEAYDHLVKAVNERFDVRGSDLSKLVMMCLDNGGKVSKHRRKQFQYSVPEAVFEFIEQRASELAAGD
ncbi:Fic family protein [Pseudomonas koreensis]|uniref:Fic family protein n=2 Tax=Pseudomonas TaxID=286 RepID=UPI003F689D01